MDQLSELKKEAEEVEAELEGCGMVCLTGLGQLDIHPGGHTSMRLKVFGWRAVFGVPKLPPQEVRLDAEA